MIGMSDKPKINLIHPDKPVSEMTEDERREFANRIFDILAGQRNPETPPQPS